LKRDLWGFSEVCLQKDPGLGETERHRRDTDVTEHTSALHALSARMNATPRKRLGFRTPAESFAAFLKGCMGVASKTASDPLRASRIGAPVDRGPLSRDADWGDRAPSEGRLGAAGRVLGHVGRDHLFQYVEV
jgi:hypothetical protein